jgi:hypothetical protein
VFASLAVLWALAQPKSSDLRHEPPRTAQFFPKAAERASDAVAQTLLHVTAGTERLTALVTMV